MTIYERIRALRKAQSMSQEQLAKLVGFEGRSAISKVENGERDIGQSMIIKYASALGVTPGYLMFGEEADEETLPPVYVTKDEREVIDLYRSLTDVQRAMIISAMKGIIHEKS